MLVIKIIGNIKQVLTALNAIGLNKSLGTLIKERRNNDLRCSYKAIQGKDRG